MATETQLYVAFIEELKRKDMVFDLQTVEGRRYVMVPMDVDDIRLVTYVYFTDLGGISVANFLEPSIAKMEHNSSWPMVQIRLNQINTESRFVTCTVDYELEDIACSYSMIIDEYNAGPACMQMLSFFVLGAINCLNELDNLVIRH